MKWRRDERGAYTLTEHDAQGRPQVTCGPFTSATEPDTCDGRPLRTETVFDEAGRVREVVHGDGTRTVTLRDRAGRRVAECRLLDAGTAVPSLPVTPPVADPEATCRAFELDALGRTVAETDANGRRTRFGFDAGGRLTSVTDAANRVTEYGFDAAGNMTSQRDALGRVTRYEFDAGGRRKARILPMLQRETLDYTVTGAVRRRTDFEGQVIDHEVARATDRTLRLVLPHDADVITEHAAGGQRASVSVGSETVEYVREGGPRRLLSQVRRNGLPWLSHEHDLAGNRTASITHDGFGNPARRTTFGHDAASRLEWVCEDCTDPGGLGAAPTCPGPAPCPAARYAHDPQTGRLASVQYGEIAPGGSFAVHVTGAYAHDALTGGLASITWSTASGELLRLDHGPYLDEAGRREGADESRDGAPVRTVAWGFDEVDRLVEERVNGAVVRTFTLDAVGNRLVETRAGEGSITHGFDDNDRLVSMNGTPLQWDGNGNLLHDGARQYGWDDLGRMTEAGARGFVYDADGLKRESGSLQHVVDASFPHAQVAEDRAAGGALVARYTRGHHPIRITTADGAWWYLHDALGSTRALVSASTLQVTDTWDYEAFGEVEASAGANASGNRWLFAGEERVGEIELDYLRARWMRPEVGRFVSRDPQEGDRRRPATRNPMPYVGSSPTALVDPSGAFAVSDAIATMVLVGVAVTTSACRAPGPWGLRAPAAEELAQLLQARAEAFEVIRFALFAAGDVTDSTSYASAPMNSLLLRRWFGATATAHRDQIQDVLSSVADNLHQLHWRVTDTPAFVEGGRIVAEAIGPGFLTNIFPAYWQLPFLDPDDVSQVSVHIHETVHHQGGPAYYDKARTYARSRDLARSSPDAARLSPMNYEGFAIEAMYEHHPCR